MKPRTLYIAAAIILMVGIIALCWHSPDAPYKPSTSPSFLSMISTACQAEDFLFCQKDGISHIVCEIVLYPDTLPSPQELLDDLNTDFTQEKNKAYLLSIFHRTSLPITVLGPDGFPQQHDLELSKAAQESVTVIDQAWYDCASGCFVRVIQANDHILFANAFDGKAVYVTSKGPNNTLYVERQPITGQFICPDSPADFLGITAGIKSAIPQQYFPPIQEVSEQRLADGTPVTVYKLGYKDPWGKLDSYYLFKQSQWDDTIVEITCVSETQTTRIHRRVTSEGVTRPTFSWTLAELDGLDTTDTEAMRVHTSDQGLGMLTPQQMAERATFDVYLFAHNPPWTQERHIFQGPDTAYPTEPMFGISYLANDGRHVVMGMAASTNQYMQGAMKALLERGESIPWTYVASNGFKILRQQDQGKMWWTEIILKSCGFDPAPNREGFFVQSPTGFYFVVAINGPISEVELHNLAESLIPASEYQDTAD